MYVSMMSLCTTLIHFEYVIINIFWTWLAAEGIILLFILKAEWRWLCQVTLSGFLSIDKYCETIRMGSKRKENLFPLNTYCADNHNFPNFSFSEFDPICPWNTSK